MHHHEALWLYFNIVCGKHCSENHMLCPPRSYGHLHYAVFQQSNYNHEGQHWFSTWRVCPVSWWDSAYPIQNQSAQMFLSLMHFDLHHCPKNILKTYLVSLNFWLLFLPSKQREQHFCPMCLCMKWPEILKSWIWKTFKHLIWLYCYEVIINVKIKYLLSNH